MAQDRISEQVSGIVACANERGLKLDGETTWRNISKFASVAVPAAGERVTLGLDRSGYIREIITAAAPQSAHSEAQPAPLSSTVDRETSIRRQACLNSAIASLGGGAGFSVDLEQVLSVAERLEAWVLR